ncbi:MAG: hypothetical protein WD115_01095 [Balneolaceae bacterium]
MVISSSSHNGLRKGKRPEILKTEWIERLDWVRQEAKKQLQWMDQIDAESTPPGGRSILGHWFDLSRLQRDRYQPLLQAILAGNTLPDVPDADDCIKESRKESSPFDPDLPKEVANGRSPLISLLESINDTQWHRLLDSDEAANESPLRTLLKEITDRDRLILREMSLQLLDRHREDVSQRELRQRLPSREES